MAMLTKVVYELCSNLQYLSSTSLKYLLSIICYVSQRLCQIARDSFCFDQRLVLINRANFPAEMTAILPGIAS
jgi:hypothetical protein